MAYLKEHEEHVAAAGYVSWGVVTIKGPLGNLYVQQCEHCPEVRASCLHTDCSWDTVTLLLICHLCGADCT